MRPQRCCAYQLIGPQLLHSLVDLPQVNWRKERAGPLSVTAGGGGSQQPVPLALSGRHRTSTYPDRATGMARQAMPRALGTQWPVRMEIQPHPLPALCLEGGTLSVCNPRGLAASRVTQNGGAPRCPAWVGVPCRAPPLPACTPGTHSA